MPRLKAVVRPCDLATPAIQFNYLPWRVSQSGTLLNKLKGKKMMKYRTAVD